MVEILNLKRKKKKHQMQGTGYPDVWKKKDYIIGMKIWFWNWNWACATFLILAENAALKRWSGQWRRKEFINI